MIPDKCLDTLVVIWNRLEKFFESIQVNFDFDSDHLFEYFYSILHKILLKSLLNPCEHVKTRRSLRFRELRSIYLSYDHTVCFRGYPRS